MTYYDAAIICRNVVGTAHGLDTLIRASRALRSLIDQSKAKLVSQCKDCDENISHDNVLWHDWEIATKDFYSNFSDIEWTWKESGKSVTKEQVEQILASENSLQISLDEL